MSKRIYLASSWRNERQPALVGHLRDRGHEVYDFRHPQSGGPMHVETPLAGFSWRSCDPHWGDAKGDPRVRFRDMLKHEAAQAGFKADFDAMQWADVCVLALPCGRSAHLEAGWMAGAGKQLVVYLPECLRTCIACSGAGWTAGLDRDRNDRCVVCDAHGEVLSWNFEPELMYLIGGDPGCLAMDHAELDDRLAQ